MLLARHWAELAPDEEVDMGRGTLRAERDIGKATGAEPDATGAGPEATEV